MAQRVRVRPARYDECPLLTALCLRSKAHWGYDAAFMAQCVAELTVRPERLEQNGVWVADIDDVPVGLYEAAINDNRTLVVELFFVEPHAMGRGVGRALWRHMEHEATRRGIACIDVEADPQALMFYERMGCRLIGGVPSRSIPGRTLPQLQKRFCDA
ncbi:MAG: GNAT family N-acetyltransferase [Pseudomonadota bacterium]